MKLLKQLFTKTVNEVEIRILPLKKRFFITSIAEIPAILSNYREQNVYFGVYTRSGGGSKEHIREATCLFADMDFKSYKGGQEEAVKILKSFPLLPSVVVDSGNGYHVYWILTLPIDAQKYRDEIESILKGISLKLLSDSNVAEIARILRVPGSYNQKCIPPKTVKVLSENDITYTLDQFDEFKVQQIAPKITIQHKETLQGLSSRCGFVKYTIENAATLPEPLWYPMISNVARLTGGPNLCHEISQGYAKYNRREVEQKILHALNASGPYTCQTIKELMKENLGMDCGLSCNVTSPIIQLRQKLTSKADNDIDAFALATDTMNYIEQRHKTKGQLSGITTGFKQIDNITDGWQPGNLITLASRPSVGKSALMLQMSRAAAICSTPVGIVSLEMGKIEKGLRYIASDTGIPIDDFRRGELSPSDFNIIMSSLSEFSILPIHFGYGAYSDIAIAAMITRMVTEKGCRLIFIDHLQLTHTSKANQNRHLELGKITSELKRLALQHSISIVLLCQLNREIEKVDRVPRMSDLRDSGAIESDSDIILMLYPLKTGNVQVYVVKGRNIGTSMVEMQYIGAITKFIETKGGAQNEGG